MKEYARLQKKRLSNNELNVLCIAGGYNYLQVGKPSLNIPLDAHMVQPEYVSREDLS